MIQPENIILDSRLVVLLSVMVLQMLDRTVHLLELCMVKDLLTVVLMVQLVDLL